MKVSYQEDLLKWVKGPEAPGSGEEEEDRRAWTIRQVELLSQEVKECTLPELETLCRRRGILIWSVKYYNPAYFKAAIAKTRRCAVQAIVEEIGVEWCSPHQLRNLVNEKNEEYGLDRYHGEITCEDVRDYDPHWFDTVFSQRFVTLSDIIEDRNPPRFRRVLDHG